METTTRSGVAVPPRSLTTYVVAATAIATALLTVASLTGAPAEMALLVSQYVVLLGGAMFVAHRSARGGIRRLFSGVGHWRIGWLNWAIVLLAMPVATIGIAVVTGAYTPPPDGWMSVVTDYLFQTLIFGALLLNIAEETVWQGMVQRNLTRRFGLLRAAAVTAIPFAVLHVPLSYFAGSTLNESLIAIALSTGVAPFMRYVVGRTDHVTGGSLLAAGVFHAGFNASGKLAVVTEWWLYAVALVVVATVILTFDALRARSTNVRLYEEEALSTTPPELALSH